MFKNRVRLVWCEGVLQRVVPALSKTSVLSHPPLLRKPRSEVLEKFHYARTLLTPGNAKFFSRSHDWVIRVYGAVGNVIETHEHTGQFKEW